MADAPGSQPEYPRRLREISRTIFAYFPAAAGQIDQIALEIENASRCPHGAKRGEPCKPCELVVRDMIDGFPYG